MKLRSSRWDFLPWNSPYLSEECFHLGSQIPKNWRNWSLNCHLFESSEVESNPWPGSMPDVRILMNDFPCLLLITIMLIAVADEVNSLSKLRQYFPRESEFCFENPSLTIANYAHISALVCPQTTIWPTAAVFQWKLQQQQSKDSSCFL